jgi:hypothetical protein
LDLKAGSKYICAAHGQFSIAFIRPIYQSFSRQPAVTARPFALAQAWSLFSIFPIATR